MSITHKALVSLGAIIVGASATLGISYSASAAPSTFFSSCRAITIRDDVLSAICRRNGNVSENSTSLQLEGINNVNGRLVFQRGTQSNYFRSCTNIQIVNDTLSANCRAENQAIRSTSLILNDISNSNGFLVNRS